MTNYTNRQLIDRIVEQTGMDEIELLEAATFDSVAWGACRNCGTVNQPHEPDAYENWCEACGENEVASVLVLAEMI
jgi:hypothetical protein